MTWKRKYIDLPTEVCAQLAQQAAAQGISQRKYIENALTARISQDSEKASREKSANRKTRK